MARTYSRDSRGRFSGGGGVEVAPRAGAKAQGWAGQARYVRRQGHCRQKQRVIVPLGAVRGYGYREQKHPPG
jgi:hypothetical protein